MNEPPNHPNIIAKPYLLLSDSETNQTDALDGLSSQETILGRGGVQEQKFELGHESVIEWLELVFDGIGDCGNSCDDLLQHELLLLANELDEDKRQENSKWWWPVKL